MKHLLSIDELDVEDLREILRITPSFAEIAQRRIAKVPALRGQTVALLFYEDSTRTRLSFEVAAKRLSADTLNVSVASSSVNKGESLRDTAETIEAMGIDAVVVRHRSSGVPWQLTKWLDASVINAGDGWHQHPTQALLDCFTLQQVLGDLDGSHVVIVGDIKHSRVARSNVWALTMLGASVTLVAPPTLLPAAVDSWPVTVSTDLDASLRSADAVYLLRMQSERQTEALVPDLREYTTLYGLTAQRAAALGPKVPILHPGPMNRGVEIAADVPDLDQVVVVDQVRNGVAVRMAVLFLLLGSGAKDLAALPALEEAVARMNAALLIRGGTVIDATGTRRQDVGVVDGVIVPPDSLPANAVTIDASDCVVTTGLVDLHAHLGEPGDEAAETMESAGRAAVLGGYTTVLAMPDTLPPVDTAAVVEHVRVLARAALCGIEIAGTVTVGAAGQRLAPLGELSAAGVRVVTDCGAGVQDPLLLRRALEYARPFGLTIAQPANCSALSSGGQMHEGEWSSRLGLPGSPAEAEEVMVMRDISLARLTRSKLHFQTLSTAGSFAIVGAARRSGVAITAEVAAHHLRLCDADVAGYDTNHKLDPPLRSSGDVLAAVNAVAQDNVDAIVTDHTPLTTDRKERPFDQAVPGSVGLETSLSVALGTGAAIEALLRSLSWRPAEILGLGSPSDRTIAPGRIADIVVIDPEERYTVSTSRQASTGTNSAFEGFELQGRARATIVGGRLVVDNGEVCA